MEAIVSLFILGILLTTVVSILRFSMVLSANALSSSGEKQDDFNELILEAGAYGTDSKDLTFTITGTGINIIAGHDVLLASGDEEAFKPE